MIILWAVTATYVFFILFLRFGMSKLKESETQHFTANTRFSIVVPFKNEEHNLPALLKSIAALDYSEGQYELILVDDHSKDKSTDFCQEFLRAHPQIKGQVLVANPGSASSAMSAIESGIQVANHEYILTLGANWMLSEGHLSALNAQLLRDNVDMIVGPVAFPVMEMREKRSFLSDFQSLDLLSMHAATQGAFGVGKPFLCSAASLCYSKMGFEASTVSTGNRHIARGDDILLLERFIEADLRLVYVKNPAAVVRISTHDTWKSLVSRRTDWTSKASVYQNSFGKWIGFLVFLTNFAFVLGIPAMLFNLLEPQHYFIAFVFKFNADFLLLYPMASFLDMESPLRRYLWCSVFYPFFISWVALGSLFSGNRYRS